MKFYLKLFLGLALLLVGLMIFGFGLRILFGGAQYHATARITIEPKAKAVDQNQQTDAVSKLRFTQSQFGVILSPEVLGRVVSALNLNVKWSKQYGNGKPLQTNQTLAILKGHLGLTPIHNTKLLDILYRSGNSNEVGIIANAVAKSYQDYCKDLQSSNSPAVQIIDLAETPKLPEPKGQISIVIFFMGLFPTIGGGLLLKSAHRALN